MTDDREHRLWGDNVPLLIARAQAIESYANLETMLAGLLATLLGTQPKLAAIVFFRVVNTRSRNTIMEKLLKAQGPASCKLFFKSVTKFIEDLDKKRNSIVHWHVIHDTEPDPKTGRLSSFVLVPPNIWEYTPTGTKVTVSEMEDFSARCHFMLRLVGEFSAFLQGRKSGDATWRKIFSQPLEYPPPDTHPLSSRYKGPESQSQE